MDLKENVIYNYETTDLLNKVNLTCKFINKKELKACYDSLLYYKNMPKIKILIC